MRKLTYLGFRKIINGKDRSEREIIRLYKSVKKMDKEILIGFIDWVNGAPYPEITVEGFDIPYLVNEYGLNPINAFIVMSWLKEDPQAAKYALYHRPKSEKISASEKEFLRKFLESKGVGVSDDSSDDTGDIEV